MAAREPWPVIVIGAGPVGLALAMDLGWRNVPCLVLERGDGAAGQPKMDMVGVRTMEFCRRWGIVDDVETCPYPRTYPQDVIYLQSLCTPELSRDPFPSMADELPPTQSPQKRERCPQNMFDPILKRNAERFETNSFQYGAEFLAAEQGPDGMVAVSFAGSDGTQVARAHYVVACDGGASRVREQLGIGMSGRGVLTYTVNILFESHEFHALGVVAPGYRYIFIDRGRAWATIVAIDGRSIFRMSLVGDDERQVLTEAKARAAVLRAVGGPLDFSILDVTHWTRRELVADTFSRGSIFLCGDACHIMSPTGGFGMNTGIADAVDLGWKLDACLSGWGGPHLLESYTLERRPVAIRNVAEATANLQRMIRAHESIRNDAQREAGQAIAEAMAAEWRTIGIHLGYRYDGSPIIVDDRSPASPDSVSTYRPTARPGGRAPHIWLLDGRSTLDLFGRGFVLLVLGSEPADVAAIVSAAFARNVPLSVVALPDPAVFTAYEQRFVLVRPDGIVAWRGDALPPDPGNILDRVRGAVPSDEIGLNLQEEDAFNANRH